MRHLSLLAAAVSALALACAAPPPGDEDTTAAADDDGDIQYAPVVLDIGIDQLHVARLDLDLDDVVVRFTDPASSLPLDRVQILADEQEPVDLDNAISNCGAPCPIGEEDCHPGYEITGGAEFVVGQGEGFVDATAGSVCAVCGWAVICAGSCRNLGPGDVPRVDPASYDTDPADDDGTGGTGGGDGGGSGGDDGGSSGGGAHDSGSGASSGGTGGGHGGVGNPGGP